MQTLRTLQKVFAQHLCAPQFGDAEDLHAVSQQLVPTGYTPQQLFSIYRNNFVISLRQTLEQLFPATQALVGADFFTQTSRQFVLSQPLEQPHLDAYGGLFVCFLSQLKALEAMPFVAKMAEVEWHLDRISHIYYQTQFDFDGLSKVQQHDHANIKFGLSNTCHLVTADVDLIQLYQNLAPVNGAPPPSLKEEDDNYQRKSHILILQNQQGESALTEIQAEHWQWLHGVQSGLTLAQLCELPHTQLDNLMIEITNWIALGCIDSFEVSSSPNDYNLDNL